MFIEIKNSSGTTLINLRHVVRVTAPTGMDILMIYPLSGDAIRIDDPAQIAMIREAVIGTR